MECFQEEPGSRSLFISDTKTVSLQEILGFDSYIHLKKATLKILKKQSTSSIQKTFRDLRSKNMEEILESECTHEERIEENGEESALKLALQLDKYS